MPSLNIIPNLEEKGFKDGEYPVRPYIGDISVGVMPKGTREGHPTVMIGLDMPDGTVMVVETTLALYLTAGDAFVARHGDPRSKV